MNFVADKDDAQMLRDIFAQGRIDPSSPHVWVSLWPNGSTSHCWCHDNPWKDLHHPPPVVKVAISDFQCGCGKCWFCGINA